MRLIDADAFRELLVVDKYGHIDTTITKIAIAMEKAKVDAELVKHGHWIFEEYPDGYYHSQCSLCNSWFSEDAFLNPYKYCPNCGASMEGVEE